MLPGINMVVAGLLSSAAGAGGGGAAPNPVSITNKSVSRTTTNGTVATASFTFATNRKVTNQAGATVETWLASTASPSDYQIRATLVSGTSPTGSSLGTWLSLSTARTWSLTDPAGSTATKTCKVKLEIRDAASPNTIRDTSTYTMNADSQSSGGTGATTFTPAPGTGYSANDNVDIGSASFTITASASVTWAWSATATAGLSASIASGGAGTTITFNYFALASDRSTTVTVTVGTNSWTITMFASGSGGFGGGGNTL